MPGTVHRVELVSDLFGVHPHTANAWAQYAQNSWAEYLEAVQSTD
jgi:hypothetical protein